MHLMQHLSHHLRKQTRSHLNYGSASAKGGNPIITRNRRIGPEVLEKKIFISCQCNFTVLQLSPLRKGMIVHLNNLDSPLPKNALCHVWLKLDKWFLRGSRK